MEDSQDETPDGVAIAVCGAFEHSVTEQEMATKQTQQHDWNSWQSLLPDPPTELQDPPRVFYSGRLGLWKRSGLFTEAEFLELVNAPAGMSLLHAAAEHGALLQRSDGSWGLLRNPTCTEGEVRRKSCRTQDSLMYLSCLRTGCRYLRRSSAHASDPRKRSRQGSRSISAIC